jgi:hypothetical protein
MVEITVITFSNPKFAFALLRHKRLHLPILRSRASGVSKDEADIVALMVRDGASRLLTMRV